MRRDLSRQTFLGMDSERDLASVVVGIIGLGGGGSHVAQQLAHVGVKKYVVADPDAVEDSNLNRLVGATAEDVHQKRKKVEIARRTILSVNPDATVHSICGNWQSGEALFRACNVIFGCVDSYSEREQLERFCRRFLIIYIDIGMDVIECPDEVRIVGQVAQSFPGVQCLRCMMIITEHKLQREAETYGAAGPKPQVIWPNGVLASAAVGLFIRAISCYGPKLEPVYLEYNGYDSILMSSPRLRYVLREHCTHYAIVSLGDPFFRLATEETKAA